MSYPCPNLKTSSDTKTNVMKKLSNIFLSLSVIAAATALTGCENDDFTYRDQARIRLAGKEIWTLGTDSLLFGFGLLGKAQNLTVEAVVPENINANGYLGYLVTDGGFSGSKQELKQPIADGKCSFRLTIDGPTVLNFENRFYTFGLAAKPGETIRLNGRSVEGASLQDEFGRIVTKSWSDYNRDLSVVNKSFPEFSGLSKSKASSEEPDSVRYCEFLAALNLAKENHRKRLIDNVNENPESMMPLVAISHSAGVVAPTEEMYDALSDKMKESAEGVAFRKFLDTRLTSRQAPEFELCDSAGVAHTLESLLEGNKYLIIDFWASWCGPCRKGIPVMKQLAKKYSKEGLAVVNISVDTDRDAWIKALDKEQMPWVNLIDTKGVKREYGVSGIPSVFLIRSSDKTVCFEKLYGNNIPAELYRIFGY